MRPRHVASTERIGLYDRLGRAYALVHDLGRSREAYEEMLAVTRDQKTEWKALLHLAVLGTDHSVRPEEDDELFRGVRHKTEKGGVPQTGTSREDNAPTAPAWSPSYALDRAGEALALAQGLGKDDLVANSFFLLALLGAWAGRWDGVAGRTAEARSLFAAMGDRAMEAEGLTLSAWGEVMLGRPREALRFGRERLAATRDLGNQDIHLADSHGLVVALLELGQYEEALSVAREELEAARSLGSPPRLFVSLMTLGDAKRALSRLEEARAAYEEMAGMVVIPQYRALVHSKLCAVCSLVGDWEEAHVRALRAVEARGEVVLQLSEPLHRPEEIEALLRGGDGDLARRETRRFGERVGANRRLRVSYLCSLAALAEWDGDFLGAVERLRGAEVLCGEIGLPGELWRVRAKLGEIHEARGDRAEAERAFIGAAEVLRDLAARIRDERLRAGFVAAPRAMHVLKRGATAAGQESTKGRDPG